MLSTVPPLRPDHDIYHRQPVGGVGQVLTVEWVREADWNRHWSVVYNGPMIRCEITRMETFTEAKKFVCGLVSHQEGAV